MILAEKGLEFEDFAILANIYYPFTFKFLAAPIMDTYFFKNFGKRKSYAMPT